VRSDDLNDVFGGLSAGLGVPGHMVADVILHEFRHQAIHDPNLQGKLDLVNRTKKVIGQLESVLRVLNEEDPCADVLQRLSAGQAAVRPRKAQ
jgi:hypothetical protein